MRTKEEIEKLEAEKEALKEEIEAGLRESGLVKINGDMSWCLYKFIHILYWLQQNNGLQRMGFYKMAYYLFKFLTMHKQLSPKTQKIDMTILSVCYSLVYEFTEKTDHSKNNQ